MIFLENRLPADDSLEISCLICYFFEKVAKWGAQWLSGRVLDSRPRGRGFKPYWRHCVVSLSKNINPSLVLVQPRKTRLFITERLLMGRKESKQKQKKRQNMKLLSAAKYWLGFRG